MICNIIAKISCCMKICCSKKLILKKTKIYDCYENNRYWASYLLFMDLLKIIWF